jgi:hypothetical protein
MVNAFFLDTVFPSINHLEEEKDDEAFDLILQKKISQCEEEYFFDRIQYEYETPELKKFLNAFLELKKSDAPDKLEFSQVGNFANLKNLKNLSFSIGVKETDLSSVRQLTQIRELELLDCYALVNLNGIENLKSLESLTLRSCFSLSNIEAIINANQLKYLQLSDTYSLSRDTVSLVQTTLPNCLVNCPISNPVSS